MPKKGTKQRRNEEAIQILATNIKKFRLQKGFTISALANFIDVDYSQISRMERGTINPTISIVFDIASILEVEPGSLLQSVKLENSK